MADYGNMNTPEQMYNGGVISPDMYDDRSPTPNMYPPRYAPYYSKMNDQERNDNTVAQLNNYTRGQLQDLVDRYNLGISQEGVTPLAVANELIRKGIFLYSSSTPAPSEGGAIMMEDGNYWGQGINPDGSINWGAKAAARTRKRYEDAGVPYPPVQTPPDESWQQRNTEGNTYPAPPQWPSDNPYNHFNLPQGHPSLPEYNTPPVYGQPSNSDPRSPVDSSIISAKPIVLPQMSPAVSRGIESTMRATMGGQANNPMSPAVSQGIASTMKAMTGGPANNPLRRRRPIR